MPTYVEKKISDFKSGDFAQGVFYIKESELKTTTTNNKYMNFTFADKTGEVNAKLWDWDEENARRFRAGILVKARGSVLDWQGQPQFKIDFMGKVLDSDNVKIEDYIPSAPYSGEAMYKFILTVIQEKMQDEAFKKITGYVVEQNKEMLLIAPAAKKNHHAVRSGLLFHTSTMLRCALTLSSIYTFLNKDLLYAGVILHDIGKLYEMKQTETGLVSEYTVEGTLLGHIIQGINYIDEVGKALEIDPEKTLLLKHMILSHHYIPEHGSPKPPAFPEAELLHYLDILDARMYDMEQAEENTETGCFSERIWSLENRSVYKSPAIYKEKQ
ncbi:MAG: 3'-5' exoribonuclease YhaM family protein [Clostridia bacterium]